jgi:hypothetical protein
VAEAGAMYPRILAGDSNPTIMVTVNGCWLSVSKAIFPMDLSFRAQN